MRKQERFAPAILERDGDLHYFCQRSADTAVGAMDIASFELMMRFLQGYTWDIDEQLVIVDHELKRPVYEFSVVQGTWDQVDEDVP